MAIDWKYVTADDEIYCDDMYYYWYVTILCLCWNES